MWFFHAENQPKQTFGLQSYANKTTTHQDIEEVHQIHPLRMVSGMRNQVFLTTVPELKLMSSNERRPASRADSSSGSSTSDSNTHSPPVSSNVESNHVTMTNRSAGKPNSLLFSIDSLLTNRAAATAAVAKNSNRPKHCKIPPESPEEEETERKRMRISPVLLQHQQLLQQAPYPMYPFLNNWINARVGLSHPTAEPEIPDDDSDDDHSEAESEYKGFDRFFQRHDVLQGLHTVLLSILCLRKAFVSVPGSQDN